MVVRILLGSEGAEGMRAVLISDSAVGGGCEESIGEALHAGSGGGVSFELDLRAGERAVETAWLDGCLGASTEP